jgi:hypothetical protein
MRWQQARDKNLAKFATFARFLEIRPMASCLPIYSRVYLK